MLAGRPVQTWLKIALVAIVVYLLLGHFVRYAALPLAAGMVGFILYRIVISEMNRAGRRTTRREPRPRRVARPRRLNAIRFDPDEDLKVPKDW